MRRIVVLCSILFSSPILAGEIVHNISWTPTLEWADGSPMLASDLDRYRYSCGATSGGPYPVEQEFDNTPEDLAAMSLVISQTAPTFFCVLSAGSDLSGTMLWSAPSNESSKDHPLPDAPTGLSAT